MHERNSVLNRPGPRSIRSYEDRNETKTAGNMPSPITSNKVTAEGKTVRTVAAEPYAWPWNGDLRPQNTALIVIDMQTDFCGKGGYIDLLGYDISLTRACIEPIRRVLGHMRRVQLDHLPTRPHRPRQHRPVIVPSGLHPHPGPPRPGRQPGPG